MPTAPGARCRSCHKIHSGTGLCPACRRLADEARGNSTARGYGSKHKRLSIAARAQAVGQVCHLCGREMLAGQALALDHTPDRKSYRGVVHLSCNARDGAQRGNAKRG